MSELCHHAWVGDDECAYCKSEELEGLLSECMTRTAEREEALKRAREEIVQYKIMFAIPLETEGGINRQ